MTGLGGFLGGLGAMRKPRATMDQMANYYTGALQQAGAGGAVDPAILEQARQFAIKQNAMAQPTAIGQQVNPGGGMWNGMSMGNGGGTGAFQQPNWNAMFGPSMLNAQEQANQAAQRVNRGPFGGPGLGNFMSMRNRRFGF